MILPADSYIVVNKGNILEIDKKILIDLYQPLIGSKAISLYLWPVSNFYLRKTLLRINYFSGVIPEEYELFRKKIYNRCFHSSSFTFCFTNEFK